MQQEYFSNDGYFRFSRAVQCQNDVRGSLYVVVCNNVLLSCSHIAFRFQGIAEMTLAVSFLYVLIYMPIYAIFEFFFSRMLLLF